MDIVLTIHSILRWLVLLFGIFAVIGAIGGLTGKTRYTSRDNKMNLFFMISCDIQLLIGLILFVTNGWFDRVKAGMGDLMKDPVGRFFTVEHAGMMILAWILVHVGRSAVKKSTLDSAKHRKVLIFSGIALVLILVSIPWPFRELVARPWFR